MSAPGWAWVLIAAALSAPAWAWILLLVAAGLVDLGLVKNHRRTLSQWVQGHARRKWAVRIAVIGVLAIFGWHLVGPGPTPDPPPVPLVDPCGEDC